MKLTLGILLLFIILSCGAQSTTRDNEFKHALAFADQEFDTGSKIDIPKLQKSLIVDLELLGRVWGFLKYHHPEVGNGIYNWDYELFRVLPSYLNNKSIAERNQILSKWIDKYGKILSCSKCTATSPDAILKPDHSWIENSDLGVDVKSKLQNIYQNRFQGKHFYIQLVKGVGNPQFLNENTYPDMPYPDAGFRLLALFKYWNSINYFYPNKHLTDKNWNVVLGEYIPLFLKAKNELEYELAVLKLIGEIQDTHANLFEGNNKIQEWKGSFYPPIKVRFIQDKLVVTDYYNPELKNEAGLLIGDIITHVDGVKVEDKIRELKPFTPASNDIVQFRNIAEDILRSKRPTLSLTYSSGSQTHRKSIRLYEKDKLNYYRYYRKEEGPSYRLLENNIGYITLSNITQEDVAKIKLAFKNTKAIIIDQRNYPSTFVPFLLGSYFQVLDPSPFVRFTFGNPGNPGEFKMGNPISIPKAPDTYQGRLVVLVNEISQSQAEYTAMAFRSAPKTTIIGSTTAGADGNVSEIGLPGGLKTMISGIGVYYPNGRETQRIGIVPDIEVKPTIEGIKKGKDELLEKAIELINK